MKPWNDNINSDPQKVTDTGNPTPSGRGGAVFAVLLLVAIAGGISFGWYFNRMAHIKSVAVKGNYYTETSDILAKADIPTDISPDSVSFLDAIHRIESLPYVKEAMLSKRPSGRLEVQVVERQPIGLLINGSSRRYFDEAGVVLPIVSGKTVDVPLVYGIGSSAISDTLKSTAFEQVRAFLLIAREDPVAASTLSEIAWTPEEGIVALSTDNGIKIVFGSVNLQEGIRNWNMFYTQVIAIRGASAFSSIDLRFNGQVVTKES